MGNTRYTCSGKSFKSCDEPKEKTVIKDQNGDPQFNVIICTKCFGVVAHEKIDAPKKEVSPKKKNKQPELEAVVPEVEEAIVLVTKQEPDPVIEEKHAPKEKPSSELEDVIVEMEHKGKTVVDILLMLKTQYGMTNSEGAKLLKNRKEQMESNQSSIKAEKIEEKPNTQKEPEQTAETVPSPLPEKEQLERESSPIKPPKVLVIAETTNHFPVNFFECVEETKSYRFKLHNEDGVEFKFEFKPSIEKYEKVAANPSVFDGKSLVFKFNKVDDAGCPVEPTLIDVK